MKKYNVAATFILSIIPGLGHLYLGLTQRGIQLMSGAFACITLIPALPLVFPFVLAIIWFYAIFDGLKRVSIINNFVEYQQGKPTEENFPSLSTVSRFSSLDEEVLYIKMMRNRRFPGEVWLGICFIIIGAVLFSKVFYPSLWAWITGQNGASLLLASCLVLFGIFTIVRSTSKEK